MITLSADGVGASRIWSGGPGIFAARGSFGGGTLALQMCETDSGIDGNWIPIGSGSDLATLAAAGSIGFTVPTGWYVRAKLTGSTTPTILYDHALVRVPSLGQG